MLRWSSCSHTMSCHTEVIPFISLSVWETLGDGLRRSSGGGEFFIVLPWTSGALDFSSHAATCRTFALWFDDYLVDGWHCSLAVWSSAHQLGVGVGRCWKHLKAMSARPVAASNWKGGKTLTDAYSMFQNLHLMQDAGRKLFDVAWNWTKRCTVIYTLNVIEC